MQRIDVLVTLGEIPLAKRAAGALVELAARAPGSAEATATAARARAVSELAEPPRRPREEVISGARSLVAKARSEREPGKWRDLAIAKHAMERAAGAAGERSLVVRTGSAAWGGDHALFTVRAFPFEPRDGQIDEARSVAGIGVAESDPRDVALSSGALRGVALVIPGDMQTPWDPPVTLPHRSGAFAVQTPAGVRVLFTGQEPPPAPLDAKGRLTLSPAGDVLVVSDGGVGSAFDTSTWQRRFQIELDAFTKPVVTATSAVWLSDVVDQPNVVVDLVTGAVRVKVTGVGALSPSGDLLARLQLDDPVKRTWSLHLHPTDGAAARRVLEFTGSESAAQTVTFEGDSRVFVSSWDSFARHCHVTAVALIEVATGRKLPIPKGREEWDCPEDGATTLGPTASGLTARMSPADAELTVSRSPIGGGQAEPKRFSLKTKLMFTALSIATTRDERFIFVCGHADLVGTFIVDLASGRTAFTEAITECQGIATRGSSVVTPDGVLDLASDPTDAPWPALISAPFADASTLARAKESRSLPSDTNGLYCRFGELLAPYEVCGPPP